MSWAVLQLSKVSKSLSRFSRGDTTSSATCLNEKCLNRCAQRCPAVASSMGWSQAQTRGPAQKHGMIHLLNVACVPWPFGVCDAGVPGRCHWPPGRTCPQVKAQAALCTSCGSATAAHQVPAAFQQHHGTPGLRLHQSMMQACRAEQPCVADRHAV